MLEKVIELLQASKNTVVLTGAGVSTGSGLPDFRSDDGLWEGKDVMKIASENAIKFQPKETVEEYVNRLHDFVDFYSWRMNEVKKHSPNQCHSVLADWQRRGIIQTLITQNVDGYHQRAGSTNVLNIHGDINSLRCSKCYRSHGTSYGLDVFCKCMGVIRPDIILFGEPVKWYSESLQACAGADLLLVLGTSLKVVTSATLLYYTIQNAGKVVIINRDPTDFDKIAEVVINGRDLGKVLTELNEAISYIV